MAAIPADLVRWVTPDFAVAPQIPVGAIPDLARLGFGLIISNRPDGEEAGQAPAAHIAQAAQAAGIGFTHAPVIGGRPVSPEAAEAMRQALLEAGDQKILAFCRSGTRSIHAWALASVAAGDLSPEEAISAAAKAGYDLRGLAPALEQAAKP